MGVYTEYSHPELGTKRVRVGFSWAAFFFTLIWLAWNRIWRWFWGWSLVLAVGAIALTKSRSMGIDYDSSSTLTQVVCIVDFAFHLVPGVWGNKWQGDRLLKRGFVVERIYDSKFP
jgi:uncharacterized protein DUF2628